MRELSLRKARSDSGLLVHFYQLLLSWLSKIVNILALFPTILPVFLLWIFSQRFFHWPSHFSLSWSSAEITDRSGWCVIVSISQRETSLSTTINSRRIRNDEQNFVFHPTRLLAQKRYWTMHFKRGAIWEWVNLSCSRQVASWVPTRNTFP